MIPRSGAKVAGHNARYREINIPWIFVDCVLRSTFGMQRHCGINSPAEIEMLQQSINAGDVAQLERLLADRPDLSSTPIPWEFGGSSNLSAPLHYVSDAAFHGLSDGANQSRIVDLLIKMGADVDQNRPESGDTPLHTAASLGQVEAARALLDNGADIEATGAYVSGQTPLAYAIEFGNAAVADLLYQRGAKVNGFEMAAGLDDSSQFESYFDQDGKLICIGQTGEQTIGDVEAAALSQAFQNAVRTGRFDNMRSLLIRSVEINGYIGGLTPLHMAAHLGNLDVATFLIEEGADPNALDQVGFHSSPYGWARQRMSKLGPGFGYAELLEYLKPLTADLNDESMDPIC